MLSSKKVAHPLTLNNVKRSSISVTPYWFDEFAQCTKCDKSFVIFRFATVIPFGDAELQFFDGMITETSIILMMLLQLTQGSAFKLDYKAGPGRDFLV